MKSILVLLHCGSNVGYAIAPLERTFYQMALTLSRGDPSRVHFAYKHMERGPTPSMPANLQYASGDLPAYVSRHGIDTLFGFDQPPSRPFYAELRQAGIKRFVSYWGAPMGSVCHWPRRMMKRLGVVLGDGPDHYIFESRGMAWLAIEGRGIPPSRTSVVHLGVDVEKYRPDPTDAAYVYEQLGIPSDRRVFFYSGHFEPRKGVAVIMQAANRLTRDDWHIVLCGNTGDQAAPYASMLSERASGHVTFAGYRNDLDRLQRGCYAAVIASSGWDSFPRSGMEMQASGLPLICSDLIGLRESIVDGETGILFPVSDGDSLAHAMAGLLDQPRWRERMSRQARERVERRFSLEVQLSRLTAIMRGSGAKTALSLDLGADLAEI